MIDSTGRTFEGDFRIWVSCSGSKSRPFRHFSCQETLGFWGKDCSLSSPSCVQMDTTDLEFFFSHIDFNLFPCCLNSGNFI